MPDTTITGLADLQRALDGLPVKLERNVMRGALRAGAKVQLAAARQAAPVGPPSTEGARLYGGRSGALRDSLRLGVRARGATIKSTVTVGGKSKGGPDVFYARFVERGTAPHDIKPKKFKSLFFAGLTRNIVSHPGAKANDFMARALRATVQSSVQAVADYIRRRLTKQGIELPDNGT